ncbi:MAG TPA: RluA family pseudouridine synthase [Gammaproteobacteria bacterium]|jgi:23S rRNA pseudouridine955/2504/2580 synthase|nr:RluA family pseudouridine synthase [Gammaproteobacteria bacterium]
MKYEKDKTQNRKSLVKYYTVTADEEGQRIDNYLINKLKGMPKSRIYRILRKGEVRVNKKRTSPSYKLEEGDEVRVPPVFLEEKAKQVAPSKTTQQLLSERILYEDEYFLIINKPAGMSVHAGSTVRVGVVEALRHLYPKLVNLELAHRLDSETTGCLILAKRKKILREVHELLREGKVTKIYWALTKGKWARGERRVDLPLHKDYRDGGKHVVEVNKHGKSALTVFSPIEEFADASLMEVKLYTGRTHQIRVHAAHQGHPLAGDDRYGDLEFNKLARQRGLKRMFLHARSIEFTLPSLNKHITVSAPLDDELEAGIKSFRRVADKSKK